MFEKFEVGKVSDFFKKMPEGIRLNITESGLQVVIAYGNPTSKEITEIKTGDIKVKCCMVKNVVFLLIKFGALDWMDVPYLSIIGNSLDPLQLIDNDNDGYGINILFGDNVTGKVKVIRLIGMSNDCSKKLYNLLAAQKESGITIAEYNRNLNDVYRRYTTNDLVKLSN